MSATEQRDHPFIAVIGHPNEGKSSVLSTLTEDDTVVVNDYPGETTHCQYFPVVIEGNTVLELVDTPGFQNPQNILRWMQQQGVTDDALLAEFVQTFGDDPVYQHDCELMKPLLQGAALIYVVDCSRPLLPVDEAEMEILRLINKPRMAVINFKDDDREYFDHWTQAFRRHFNVIREFNAHQARFQERIALLETLKAIQQSWEPAINRAIAAFTKDWQARSDQAVQAITEYLSFALRLQVEQSFPEQAQRADIESQAVQQYQSKIVAKEQALFDQLRGFYHHTVFELELAEHSVLREDLFSDTTWDVLGLTKKQLTIAATGMGAGIGATLDLATGGLSHGLFAAAGALFAGSSVYFKGAELTRVKLKHLPLGGTKIVVGPNQNPQFPVVLLDRALLYYRETVNHAHGNRSGELPDLTDQSVMRHVASGQQKKLLSLSHKLGKGSYHNLDALQTELNSLLLEILSEGGER